MSNVGSYDPNKPRSGNFTPKAKTLGFTKDNPTILARILPPFKSLKDKNAVAYFWSIIWLTGPNGKPRPVPSLQRKANKQIVQADPILEKANAMLLMIENAEKNGENPQVIAQLKERVKSLRPDNKYYLNVLTPAGEIRVLKIPYTCYELLDAKLKKLASEGFDAVGPGPTSGVFFEFKRWQDNQGKWQFSVDPATQHTRNPQTGLIGLAYKHAPIDDTIIQRMEREAADLPNLYTPRTMEEQALLASLDPAVIGRVLMKPQEVEEDGDEPEENGPAGTVQGYQMPAQAAAPAPQPVIAAPPPAPVALAPQPAAPVAAVFGANAGIPDDVRKFLFATSQAGAPGTNK